MLHETVREITSTAIAHKSYQIGLRKKNHQVTSIQDFINTQSSGILSNALKPYQAKQKNI